MSASSIRRTSRTGMPHEATRADRPVGRGVAHTSPAASERPLRRRREPRPGVRLREAMRAPMVRPRAAIDIDGVRLTSPDRVLYPEQGITKRELAAYYLSVADRMLPHVAGRPVTLVRCSAGRQTACFHQRHAGASVPPGIER